MLQYTIYETHFISSPRGQNVQNDIFKCIFKNKKFGIRIALKCVPDGLIYNEAALNQAMALHRAGGKRLITWIMLAKLIDAHMEN